MAEYPALPLFTDAYLADTRHLTTSQHGAYLLMLMTAWRSPDCSLPNDDSYLSRICGMDRRTWNVNKEILLSFWSKSGEGSQTKLFQKRLKDERNYVEEKRSKNVAAGNSSALKRKERHSTGVGTKTQHKPNQPTPTPNIPSEDISSSGIDAPQDVRMETWKAFLEMRKKKRATNSEYAIGLIFSEINKLKEQGFSPQELIDQSIRNSWIDIYPIKEKTNERNFKNNQESKTTDDRARAAVMRAAMAGGFAPTG